MSDNRRAAVESMAVQALFRWPNLAKEIGITALHFLNRAEERALAKAALETLALTPTGAVPLANAAAAAGVTLDWLRANFVATFFDPSQGRYWMEELEALEYARQLKEKIDRAVDLVAPGELDDAIIGVTREHQRERRKGHGALLNMEELSVAYLNDQDERGEEIAAIPIGYGFPSLTWALRGGWHRDECTGIIAGGGVGKTTLGESFRRLLAQRGIFTINFNAEMTKNQMAERFVYAEARMSPTQQMDAATRSQVRERIIGSGVARRMRVYDASHLNPEAMERAIETEKELVGAIGLFVVDHSTKVGRHRNSELKEWEVIYQAAVAVKEIVKSTEVAGILLAHMTTAAGAQEDPNWEPTAADSAGGKIMYKEMDNLLAIWRTPAGTWGKVLKARMNGEARGMKFRLHFDVPTQSFCEAPTADIP